MNPFTTIPKLLTVYNGAQKYNRAIRAFKAQSQEERIEEEKALIRKEQKAFVETISSKCKITYDIVGEDNLPVPLTGEFPDSYSGSFMVYSNHQSFADIFAILWLLKDICQIGFVAKEEWRKVKPLADAIEYTRSVFINRNNGRDAIKTITEAKELLDKGFNLAIFPEGTRSQKHGMAEFKPGAFKFAQKAKVPILPVTLDGGYHLLEETGSYQPTHITITVHPLVHIEQMSKEEQKMAASAIEATIRNALD